MKVQMTRVQIVGLKSSLLPTVHLLHELGCVQIEDLTEVNDISARPLELDRLTVQQRETIAHLVVKIEGLITILAAARPGERVAHTLVSDASLRSDASPRSGECISEAQAGVEQLGPEVQALVARREALEAEQASLPRYELTLRRLLPFVPTAGRPGNGTAGSNHQAFVGVMVSRAHSWVLDTIAEEALKLTAGQAETGVGDIDEGTRAMVIVFPQRFAPQIETLLGREDISRLRLPDGVAGQPPATAVLTLTQRLAAIPHELTALQQELVTLADTWLPRLMAWRACLRDRLEEINVLSRLGETDHTFVLAGWMPQREVTRLQAALAEQVGTTAILQTIPMSPADYQRMPVALINPAPARPFESLVRLLNLPRYEDVDPTQLMALFLPLFFGMILGDVGYGLLLLLLCLVGLRRFPKAGVQRDIIQILALGAGWAILFGFLYGEAFGTLGEHLGMHALWLERASSEQVFSLLLFAIAVGAVHVILGLVIGVWEAVRARSRSHLLERGGMLVGLIGLFCLTAALADWLPQGFMRPGVAILLIGIVILSSSQGWIGLLLGPIEFIGLLGNVLSYLRIAAVGLASVYVAHLANNLAGSLGSILLGVIVATLLHALNLALGAFSPTIHSMRLHYVEFFRKFYEGGGRPFEPFRKTIF